MSACLSDKSAMSKAVKNLEEECLQSQAKVRGVEDENRVLREKIQELQKNYYQLQMELESKIKVLQQENGSLKISSQDKSNMQKSQASQTTQIRELEAKLLDSSMRANQLELQYKNSVEDNDQLKDQIRMLEEDNAGLRQQLQDVQQDANQKGVSYTQEIQAMNEQNLKLRTEIADKEYLKQSLQDKLKEIQILEDQLQEASNVKDELGGKLATCENSLEEMAAVLKEVRLENEELQNNVKQQFE